MIRPITLFPFPYDTYKECVTAKSVRHILDIELSMGGQMIEDVKLAVSGAVPVLYLGRSGGNVMTDEDIVHAVTGGMING